MVRGFLPLYDRAQVRGSIPSGATQQVPRRLGLRVDGMGVTSPPGAVFG
jgi:hypothetical protein